MAPRICSSRHHCTRGHFYYYTNSCRSRRLVVGFREKQVTERVSECIDLEQLLHWELTGCRIPIPATGSSLLSRNQGTNRHKNTKAHGDELHRPHALRQEAEGLGSEDLDSIVSERLTLHSSCVLGLYSACRGGDQTHPCKDCWDACPGGCAVEAGGGWQVLGPTRHHCEPHAAATKPPWGGPPLPICMQRPARLPPPPTCSALLPISLAVDLVRAAREIETPGAV
jgi:hypothetical protein